MQTRDIENSFEQTKGSPRFSGASIGTSPMRRILIIDDDEAMRSMIRHRLEGDFEIVDTGDPTEALALALEHKPDCILLDLTMPLFSGLELCQTFCSLSNTRMIPIFVITGQSASAHQDACLNLGASEFFQKPLDFKRLRTSLQTLPTNERKDRRGEVRVRLKVVLKLAGKDMKEKEFELVTCSDEVSVSGFSCRFPLVLRENAIVQVFQLGAAGERVVGEARLVHTEWAGLPWQACGFIFTAKKGAWIL
jgi:CheY-like chemotaxis protein